MKTTISLILLLVLSTGAHAQLVKCISKDGRVEYASQCPPGTRQEATGIKSTPSTASPAATPAQKSPAEREAEFRKRMSEKEEAQGKDAKQAAEAQQRARACEDARSYLARLQARDRVVRTDPKTGERVFLEETEYLKEIAAAQRSIDTNCK